MNTKHLLAIGLAVICALVFGIYLGKNGNIPRVATDGQQAKTPSASAQPRLPVPAYKGANAGSSSPNIKTADPQSELQKYASQFPTSAADVAWLRAHGYPDADASMAYFNMSDSVLAELAGKGDKLAATVIARRKLEKGGGQEAVDDLLKIAASGSTFALDQLGSTYQAIGGERLFLAEAYYEVARKLGDRMPVVANSKGQSLSPLELALAMQYSDVVLARMNALRKLQGIAPLQYSPRPDAQQAFETSYQYYQYMQEQEKTKSPPKP